MTWTVKLIKYYNKAQDAGETLCVAFALTHKAVLPDTKLQKTILSSQTENPNIFLIASCAWIFCHFVGSHHKAALTLLTTSCIKWATLLFKQRWNCRGQKGSIILSKWLASINVNGSQCQSMSQQWCQYQYNIYWHISVLILLGLLWVPYVLECIWKWGFCIFKGFSLCY